MLRRLPRLRLRRPPHRKTPGAPPGHFEIDPAAQASACRLFTYGSDDLDERSVPADEVADVAKSRAVAWLDIQGLGTESAIRGAGAAFNIHPLTLEDAVHVHQRAKSEVFDGHHTVVMRVARFDQGELVTEQLTLVVGSGWLVSFQERPGDAFETVRERLRNGRGRLRRLGADYLAYALMDATVDHYFPMLEEFGELLDTIELELFARPGPKTLQRIHRVRSQLRSLRRVIWPMRDALHVLLRDDTPIFGQDTALYLRDTLDHALRAAEIVESHRDAANGLMDLYLSAQSHHMNEVMQVLTVVATIFIPLTFITGLYGMNFDPDVSPLNMPETKWEYGYLMAIGFMVLTTAATIVVFRRRGLLGGRPPAQGESAAGDE